MLRPDQYAPVTAAQRNLIWMTLRLLQTEFNRDGLRQITVRITYHVDTSLPKFIFTPPDRIMAIRPGNIAKGNWDEYRAGLYDCAAAYWSWQIRADSLKAASNAPIPNTVQIVRYHPIGSPGWRILRERIRKKMGV